MMTPVPSTHLLKVNFSVFFKHITAQLLAGSHERDKLLDGGDHADKNNLGGGILLMCEAFTCNSRRGSADVLLGVVVPEIHKHVQSFFLPPNSDIHIGEAFQLAPGLVKDDGVNQRPLLLRKND